MRNTRRGSAGRKRRKFSKGRKGSAWKNAGKAHKRFRSKLAGDRY